MNPLLKSLRARHEIVDTKIRIEQQAIQPDSVRLSILKRIKLRLRDQIAALERMGHEIHENARHTRGMRAASIKV